MKHPFTALSVAKLFMLHVYWLHGLPTTIVSDRDRIFTSQLCVSYSVSQEYSYE